MTNLILFLLLAHWFGDFACQNRWIAENKGKNVFVLTLHVVIYTFVLGSLLEVYSNIAGMQLSNFIPFVLVNLILHFTTDFFTSKMTTYWHNKQNMYGFFSTIGFDQLVHQFCLIITANLLQGI